MFKQMSEYFQEFLLKYQCKFRKGLPNNAFLPMLEKGKSSIDNRKTFAALLADLSKAFDCFLHDLLIVKLKA